jgi:hypothetical protein
MDNQELPWLEDKEFITKSYFEVIQKNNSEFYKLLKDHVGNLHGYLPIVNFIIDRLEAVSQLITEYRVWDAEIVMRSVIETTVKYLFIVTADKEERNKRLDEYWNSLAEVNSLKMSEQAKKNLAHMGNIETHRLAYSPMLLPEEIELQLRSKWTNAERKRLEQKWSFTEMVNALSKNYRGHALNEFIVITHSYRMGSHVTHGDETGIGIIRERDSRSPFDRELAYFTHYLRILSDINAFCGLVAKETVNTESIAGIYELTEKYHAELFKDPVYDKFRR